METVERRPTIAHGQLAMREFRLAAARSGNRSISRGRKRT